MPRQHRQATGILEDIAKSIDDHLDEKNDVNVFAMPARMPIVNNFVLLFYNAFLQTIDDYGLTLNDVRVMLKIIDLMKFGNLVKISWTDVAKGLGISHTNMPRHLKKLRAAQLLIDDENGSTFLNPQIISKGKFLKKGDNEELIRILDLGAEALEKTGRKPNIKTPRMQQKEFEEKIKLQQLGLPGVLQ